MSKHASKDYLRVAKMHKELIWLSYDPDYKDIDLKVAIDILAQLKSKLAAELSK